MNETILSEITPAAGTGALSTTAVTTTGDDLSRLVWRGSFLTIVTLGIYRFWYKTNLRRWYWQNTQVGGSAFEYRGTAKEKFLGFLFALAVVLPIYFMGTLVALFSSEAIGNVLSGFSGLVIALLVQYGAYRSRRYRLTRSVWRGLRFDLKGSAMRYALKSAGWAILTLITLGLAFPALRRALEEYRINNTWFGSAQGHFTAKTGPLMRRWLVLWTGPLVLAGVTASLISKNPGEPTFLAILFSFLVVLWPFLFWPWYRANEFRHFTKHTVIGPVSFDSAFNTKAYYWRFFKFGLWALVVLICMAAVFFSVLSATFASLFRLPIQTTSPHLIVVTVFGIGLYVALFYLISCLKETILNQGFWRLATATMLIHNLDAVEGILGSAVADEAATGEGLADALDFGGI